MADLRLFLLGSPRIERDGIPVSLETRRATALLAYIAVSGPQVTRVALADLLFPEYGSERAFANLRRALWALNKAGLGPWLDIRVEQVAWKEDARPWVDIDEFHRLIGGCALPAADLDATQLASLEAAAALYRDDFLAGFSLKDSPPFDDWQFFQADSLRRELATVLENLSRGLAGQGQVEPAITHARRWLALDPLHEAAQRWLMQLYVQAGQRSAALRQYQECARILQEELGVPPEAETVDLYQEIWRGGETGQLRSTGPLILQPSPLAPALPIPPHNLPVLPTPFIGRRQELGQIGNLLADPACRLLTLVGPGGIGKTRLALQVAGEQLHAFQDGVCFVELAPLRVPELLASTIQEALRMLGLVRQDGQAGRGEPEAALLRLLQDKHLLLVLDSFEHLLRVAGFLSEALAQAPQIKILVTSRERLDLQEGWTLEVRGLDYPEFPAAAGEDSSAQRLTAAGLEGYSAAVLFLQSALRVRPDFHLTPDSTRSIVRICQLVQGMPLGIELAAAWIRSLPCDEIALEIECSLDLLTTSLRNVPERHRSLRAVFDSSWQRLSEEEKEIFGWLTLFRGGFSGGAARQVTGASLAELTALLDKSWLRYRPDGRYTIHELLRQYGGEHLDEEPSKGMDARDRHSRHYLACLRHSEADLKGAGQLAALQEIRMDLENVRAAWEWAIERQDWEGISGAAKALWTFHFYVSTFGEGQAMFQAAAEPLARRVEAGTGGVRATGILGRLLARQGAFSLLVGRLGAARELLERGQALCSRAGDQAEAAFALNWLANLAYAQGNLPEARQLYEESLQLRRSLDDPGSTATSLYNMGSLLGYFGEYTEARRLCEESLAIRRTIGDRVGLAFVLADLGGIALHQGELAEARQFFAEGLAMRGELEDAICIPYSYSRADLSDVAYLLGEYAEAERLVRASLVDLRRAGNRWNIPFALGRLGLIRCAQGACQEARDLLQESLALAGEHLEPLASAQLLNRLGQVLTVAGEYAEAGDCHQRSLAIARGRNHLPETAAALAGQGQAAYGQAAYDRARQLCSEALAMFDAMGARHEVATLLTTLGDVARCLGDHSLAHQHLSNAWHVAQEIEAVPLALSIQVSMAELSLAECGRGNQGVVDHDEPLAPVSTPAHTVELLALPLSDPRTAHPVRRRAEALLALLAEASPSR